MEKKKSLISAIRSMFKRTTTTAAAVGVSCALAACSQAGPTGGPSSDPAPDSSSVPAASSFRVSSVVVSYETGGQKTGESTYSFKRDESGNIVSVELSGPTTGNCEYQVDESGRVVSSIVKRQGRDDDNVTYTYDASGRLVKEVHDTVSTYEINYEYDEKGRLARKSCNNQDGPYDSEYSYDDQGRLISEKTTTVAPSSTLTEYTYDVDGNVISAHTTYTNFDGSMSDAGSVIYSYENGKLISVSYDSAQGMVPITYKYGDDGNLLVAAAGEEMGNYDAADFTYDENGLLIDVEENLKFEGSSDVRVVRTSITYEKVSVAEDADVNDISVDVYRGPQRAMDVIDMVTMTQHAQGAIDPTPFASESSFILK